MALEGKGGKEGRELPDLPHGERDPACSRTLSLRCCVFTPWRRCGVQPVVELLNVISKEKEPVAKD